MEPANEGAANPKSESDQRPNLHFPSWYNPYAPEVIERRRKLFADIARNRTPETDAAMEKVYQMFIEDKHFE